MDLAVPHNHSLATSFQSHSVRPERPASPHNGSLWLAQAYLAVRGADRKPNVGGDHHGEGRGQLNREATVGGNRKTTSQELFVWPCRHPVAAEVLPEHSVN